MPINLGELATRFGCDLRGSPDVEVDKVASLAAADPRSLGFFTNPALAHQLAATRAAAVILREDAAAGAPCAALISANPYATYARIAAALHPPPALHAGVHPTAVVDTRASLAPTAQVGPHAVIEADSVIGDRVFIGPGVFIGPDCSVGADSRILSGVKLVRAVRTGERCIVHPGAIIGADGFGNAMTEEGWIKVPQLGGVTVGSDVEIGSNTTIDCGAVEDTVIGDGVRIDNLCMIAHNVTIGPHTALAAMTGIAGSTVIGARCMFAGQSGAVGHVTICDDVVVSGQAMVTKDIVEPGVYASAFPAIPVRDWNRAAVRLRRIDSLYDRVRALEEEQG